MGLFKEVFCTECGKKAGLFTRIRLADDSCLCSECAKIVPHYMHDTVCENYTIEDYHNFKEYIKYSDRELKPIYHENHDFYSIGMDTRNGILCLDRWETLNPLYIKLTNVLEYEMNFEPDEVKEGMLGDKVYGKIYFKINVSKPEFYYETVLDSHAKAKAKVKNSFFKSTLSYENPAGMDEFLHFLVSSYNSHAESEAYDNYQANVRETANSELAQAMALFMIDDIDKVTLADVRAQRNRLIKTFHPDGGTDSDTQYAQKINGAYEIIKQYIESTSHA